MTTIEMHIGVNLILQKINSNIIATVKDEEIDRFLNDEMLRFINQRIEPLSNDKKLGFQTNEKRYEDLKALITPIKDLVMFTGDNNSVWTYIPSNCLKLIDSRSLVKNLCGASYAPTTSAKVIYYNTYKFLKSGATNYLHFVFKINSVVIFQTDDYPQFSAGLDPEMNFEMVDFMLEKIRAAGYEAGYEKLLDQFATDSIIISSYSASINITVIYNGGSPVTTTPSNESLTRIDVVTGTSQYKNRLTKTEEVFDLLPLSFGSTMYFSPLSSLEGNKLNVFHNQKFIVSSVSLDFIRIPKKISLPLSQGCELDANVHQEIVDNAAKRIAGITTAPNYAQIQNENILKE